MNNDNQTPATIQARITSYYYDVSKPEEAETYKKLKAKLTAAGNRLFNVYTDPRKQGLNYTGPIELEIEHLFSNQWDTRPIPGRDDDKRHRVFDWYEGIFPNKDIKEGRYIDLTPEIKALRDNRLQCGYCGHQEDSKPGQPHPTFCGHCLDSEYLKEEDFKLLRLMPVSFEGDRPELTDQETAELMPKYVEAQTKLNEAKAVKKRAQLIVDRDKLIARANAEHDGFMWLLDHGINTDNCIFYTHTGRFGFGWRSSIQADEVKAELLTRLAGFPFPYDIK